MAPQRLVGSRIREKRLDRGLRQSAVAETVGISPSYLNLIEHNRRRIGGKLLSDLARVLQVETALLTDGADSEMLHQMRAAAGLYGPKVEVDRTEELAARYPGWSALIAAQARRIAALQEQLRVLNDRMTYDPQLAGSLHAVISAVTSIRSSASILIGPEKLDDDWQRRFHENIHDDSLRLAASSEALIAYLEAPDPDVDADSSVFEQAEAYLAQTGFHLRALEDQTTGADAVVAAAGLSNEAASVLARYAAQYQQDAACLPLAPFEKACREHAYDPSIIAQTFDAPFSAVLRRMAALPPDAGHPPIGMVSCDAAGALTLVKSVPGFWMPRSGGACPLWPLFSAISRPAQPVRLDVALPGPNPTRFLCYAMATPVATPLFDVPPAIQSVMLVMPDPPEPTTAVLSVGISCRICARNGCRSRREPAMAGVAPQTAL